jgi:glyoxylase-like metal-dependent hydrolase (beta-lactamase superfamily II)
MQEISENVFVENSFLGVTLGAINLPHGLLLIDAPPRQEDVRSWRASLLNLGGGVDRLLVNLDAHVDRTLGVRAMECTVVAQEKTSQVFRNRPTAFKAQDTETGADWELVNNLGSIRWAPPEITFTHRMLIHWDDQPAILEHHPGPQAGAVWVVLPASKVAFIGDLVTPHQPPFLALADLPGWIEALELLLSPEYAGYLLVSGRTGLVTIDEVRTHLDFSKKLCTQLDVLTEQKATPESAENLIPDLLAYMDFSQQRQEQFIKRLRWGLYYYLTRHTRANFSEEVEE